MKALRSQDPKTKQNKRRRQGVSRRIFFLISGIVVGQDIKNIFIIKSLWAKELHHLLEKVEAALWSEVPCALRVCAAPCCCCGRLFQIK
jgi:hypothetical protein